MVNGKMLGFISFSPTKLSGGQRGLMLVNPATCFEPPGAHSVIRKIVQKNPDLFVKCVYKQVELDTIPFS